MKKIILADDHSFIRIGLVQIIKDEYPAIEIVEVSTGNDLVHAVIKGKFDLVITDLEMPGLNGLEALEQIKQIHPNLPVLILSIYDEDLYAVRAMKAGASGYLNKNTAPEELIKAIQRIQLGKKYITEAVSEKLLSQLDGSKNPHEQLTNREFEIFKALASGKSLSDIAQEINLALTTVSTHKTRIFKKLQVNSNADLVRYAIQHKVIKDIH